MNFRQSNEYVEYVVNAPQKPIARNGHIISSLYVYPIKKLPKALITKMVINGTDGKKIRHPYRAKTPRSPPSRTNHIVIA